VNSQNLTKNKVHNQPFYNPRLYKMVAVKVVVEAVKPIIITQSGTEHANLNINGNPNPKKTLIQR
jgi:hypothetical protein